MNERVQNLLQLYENTLAQHGFMRRREEGNASTSERQLCHARWMLDKAMQDAGREKWSEAKLDRWIGLVQGILWSNNVFSAPALEDHIKQLDLAPAEAPAKVTAE
jgi:hypothetical protein